MKKIFTLLFTAAMLSTAFAQNGQRGQQRNSKGNDDFTSNKNQAYDHHGNTYHGEYYFTPGERHMEIAKINRIYDYRIQSVKRQMFMSWFMKKRQIRNLEHQRTHDIQRVMDKFNDRRNQYGDYARKHKKRGRYY